LKRFIREYALSAGEIAVVLFAWGDVRGFFAHGARAGTVVVLLTTPLITYWNESERTNRGLSSVSGQWRTLALLEVGFFVSFLVVPYCDRHELLVFAESDALRYAGLLLFVTGVVIRVWAYIYLGRFFSVFLTIQKGHRLIKDNIYGYVRHPSYTGLIVRSLGWVLVFRSIVGLGAWVVLVAFLLKRIGHEERVLASGFGAEWEEYKGRTRWRLLPGIY
jgi:protein-S-isoprenylcysteine O-methyltransferase Ste14